MHFQVVRPFYLLNMHPILDTGRVFEEDLSISFVVAFGVYIILSCQ